MEKNRKALWLLILSPILILLGGLLDWPASLLMISLRMILPLMVIAYLGLMLAGYVSPRQ